MSSNKPATTIDLDRSIYEGVFSHMFATLTGGVFLTGFALHLGMDEFKIGLLAAMPFLVTVFQLPASHLMGRTGDRKKFWYCGNAIARGMWIPVVLVALVPVSSMTFRASVILCLILVSYSGVTIAHVAWLSLMSDLVPDRIRGHFFGTRNMLCGAAGMTVMLIFGNFLDFLKEHSDRLLSAGFAITFVAAVAFGLLSLRIVKTISDPHSSRVTTPRSFTDDLTTPIREDNFKRFLVYAFCWSFSVHFAAPFFTLYFLRDLKFSYGFVAALGIVSGLADLTGMRLWGRISDRVKNRPIIRLSGLIVAFVPLAWVFVRPGGVLIPVAIHIVAGGFWAGINLCTSNLLLRVSPQENKAPFLSLYNTVGGLGAAASPIAAGLLFRYLDDVDLSLFSWPVLPLHVIFLISTMLRLSSLQFFRRVHEPEEGEVGELLRILRGIRGLNVAAGFNYLLHPFVEFARNGFGNGSTEGLLNQMQEGEVVRGGSRDTSLFAKSKYDVFVQEAVTSKGRSRSV